MRPFLKGALVTAGVFALIGIIGLIGFMSTGFAAKPTPGSLETFFALRVRNMAIARQSRRLRNPIERSPEVIASARGHWADHCATCHANDGSGDTEMGRGLYPRVPDMRLERTQGLSDGQLFYIIENGVRLTGMPAWGTGTKEGEEASWHLVHFIRHLPEVSDAEIAEMESLNPMPPDVWREREEERRFLEGDESPAPQPSPSHEHGGK